MNSLDRYFGRVYPLSRKSYHLFQSSQSVWMTVQVICQFESSETKLGQKRVFHQDKLNAIE